MFPYWIVLSQIRWLFERRVGAQKEKFVMKKYYFSWKGSPILIIFGMKKFGTLF
jgi:hypothetical protein